MKRSLLALVVAQSTASVFAAVNLASIFTDGAILQREQKVAIWGTADAGEQVEVKFGDASVSTKANSQGRWLLRLPAFAASSEPRELIVSGESNGKKTEIRRRDILVGDVWLCAGQSNIEWPVRLSVGGEEAAAKANFPTIRHVKISRTTALAPREDTTSEWKSATPENTPHFTAVGFYFARALQSRINVPIGLINCTFGGTSVESWFHLGTLRATKAGAESLAAWDKEWETWFTKFEGFEDGLSSSDDKAAAVSKPSPPPEYRAPTGAFNGMLYSLIPYTLKGVYWYQGESNVGRPTQYRELFPAMISSWRKHWAAPELAFLFVQLPNFKSPWDTTGMGWAELRDAQTSALDLPNTAMVVTIDAGDPADLHPREKQTIGLRAAALAASNFYGLPGAKSSPRISKVIREGQDLRLSFASTGEGLTLRDTAASGFEVAGADGIFHNVRAAVQGQEVVLHCRDISHPEKVRYAWHDVPTSSLYSKDGLPAAPFSLDIK